MHRNVINGRIFRSCYFYYFNNAVKLKFRGKCFSTSSSNDKIIDLSQFDVTKIRNFSIVAHIDHGKSTLADGLLEYTGTISAQNENAQVLDKLRVERERGITVKAQTATMFYKLKGETYLLNLIDTPGHVDFSYEVSRSLAACDGALLLVDANQGVEAQTVANFWLAFDLDLTILGALNKIDMPTAKPQVVSEQMNKLFEIAPSEIAHVSAKLRKGIGPLLEKIVAEVKCPNGQRQNNLKAFVFDSWFDLYRGCYALVLIKDGVLKVGDEIYSMKANKRHVVQQVGIMNPEPKPTSALYAGQVGYFLANIRDVHDVMMGDTFCLYEQRNIVQPVPGFKKAKPVVFAGLYPVDPADYDDLRVSVERLLLNDPSVHSEPVSSPALGLGWRMGFLGLLHMEVFIQRLEDEYEASTILTAPTVSYVIKIKDNDTIRKRYDNRAELLINDPGKFPEIVTDIEECFEPMALCTIITPLEYYKQLEILCDERRGQQRESTMIDNDRMMLKYRFPLAGIIVDFVGSLKKVSSGYASFDYELDGYESADLVKLNILINGQAVEEFSTITLRPDARKLGLQLCQKLTQEIPRQLYEISIQAAIGGKTVARTNIRAMTKNFAQKLKNNLDKSRLGKLVARQKEGQKRMKLINQVQIPKEAFLNVLRR